MHRNRPSKIPVPVAAGAHTRLAPCACTAVAAERFTVRVPTAPSGARAPRRVPRAPPRRSRFRHVRRAAQLAADLHDPPRWLLDRARARSARDGGIPWRNTSRSWVVENEASDRTDPARCDCRARESPCGDGVGDRQRGPVGIVRSTARSRSSSTARISPACEAEAPTRRAPTSTTRRPALACRLTSSASSLPARTELRGVSARLQHRRRASAGDHRGGLDSQHTERGQAEALRWLVIDTVAGCAGTFRVPRDGRVSRRRRLRRLGLRVGAS
jgi:hypothetical protein